MVIVRHLSAVMLSRQQQRCYRVREACIAAENPYVTGIHPWPLRFSGKRAARPWRKPKRATRRAAACQPWHRGPRKDAATLGSPVLLSRSRAQRRHSFGGHHPQSLKPKIGNAHGVARSRRSFQSKRKPFRTTRTEVITTIHTRPKRARWSASDRSPQGEPTLPATRHFQVEREWCPVTLAA
jgi:hypothetical protein